MKRSLILSILTIITFCNIQSQTWVQTLNGIGIWALCRDVQGNVYAGASGTTKAVYKTTNGGLNWLTLLPNGVSNFLGVSVDSLGNIFATNSSNGLMKSTDGGNNWTTIPVTVFNSKNVQTVICGKNGVVCVGTVSGGVFRSTDYGVTFPDTSIASTSVVTFAVDRYNSNIIYAGTSALSGLTGFFVSTNSGYSFTGPLVTNNCWGIVQKSPTEIYYSTTTTGYPFNKSTDGGYTWTVPGYQPGAMRGAALDLAGNIYISGNGGVFKTTNNGVSFTNFGVTASCNQSICVGNKLYVAATGTSTGGVWIYTDSTISNINPENSGIPSKFELEQNYPNPFNQSTVINYQLTVRENVSIKLYDINGRLIETIVSGNHTPGNYRIVFDAGKYSSGVYYYKMKAGEFSDTKKMLLIK